MRLLVLTSSFPESPEDGVCGYVYDLARRLAEEFGHEVRVIAPEGGAGDDAGFAPVRVERVRHPWAGKRRLDASSDMGAAVRGSAAARTEAVSLSASLLARAAGAAREFDAILSHWLVPAGAVAAAVRVPGTPHVAIAHGGDVHLLRRLPAGRQAARFIASRSERMVFVTRGLRDRFAPLLGEARFEAFDRAEVVPMGAEIGPPAGGDDVRRAREAASGRVIALFLGRLHHIKGADVLVQAASEVEGLEVWIAGEGPELESLRGRAAAARLPVSFLGRIDRRRRRLLLDACDVVVVPSRVEASGRAEGAPVVCAEALAAGRPVVASRSGGIEEVIEDGRTGLLVPPAEAGALSAALTRLARDTALRERLSAAAAEAGRSLTMAATAARFHEILGEARDRSSRKAR